MLCQREYLRTTRALASRSNRSSFDRMRSACAQHTAEGNLNRPPLPLAFFLNACNECVVFLLRLTGLFQAD